MNLQCKRGLEWPTPLVWDNELDKKTCIKPNHHLVLLKHLQNLYSKIVRKINVKNFIHTRIHTNTKCILKK